MATQSDSHQEEEDGNASPVELRNDPMDAVSWLCPVSEKDYRKRRCMRWQTVKPSSGKALESDAFYFCGIRCWLSLTYESGWYKLCLKYEENFNCRPFVSRVTVFLEESSSYILPDFSNKRFFLRSTTCIWCCHETYILSLIPDFALSDCLRFLVMEDNIESALSLETDASDKSDLRLLVTYAGPCLDELANVVWGILNEQSELDVKLVCRDRTFMARRDDLCRQSPVFRAMLQSSDMIEKQTGIVPIRDIDREIFEQFLVCLYSGQLPDTLCLTANLATQLYQIGDMYAIEWLPKTCGDFLCKNLTDDTVCELLTLAEDYNDTDLKEAVTCHILDSRIFLRDEYWLDFCEDRPKLALAVLNRFVRTENESRPNKNEPEETNLEKVQNVLETLARVL